MRFLRSFLLLLVALLCVALPSRAQSQPPVSEGGSASEALIAEGVELRKQGKERDALEKFERAYAIDPTPRAMAQMGLASKSLRMFVQAEEYLGRALAEATDPWIVENKDALALALEVVKKNLAWLEVHANVADAELSVDGNSVGTLPLKAPVRVRAGAIRIDIRAEGFEAWSARETLVGGGTGSVNARLKVLTPVVTKPASPAPRLDHRPVEPPPDGSRALWMWSTLGVGVAGVAVGTAFGLRSLSLKKDRDAECPTSTCTSIKGVELDEDARTVATWSTVGFVVGAAGLGSATALFLTQPSKRKKSARRSLELRVSPLGAVAVGAF
jgi:hypothetical protein